MKFTPIKQEEVNMKNVFAFVAGGVVALAGVILGSGVKAAKDSK